jgi:hypothetical protein
MPLILRSKRTSFAAGIQANARTLFFDMVFIDLLGSCLRNIAVTSLRLLDPVHRESWNAPSTRFHVLLSHIAVCGIMATGIKGETCLMYCPKCSLPQPKALLQYY